jgi:hypothetical protein
VVAVGRQIETEATPIRYVAELVGAGGGDDERAIRWLIALMVLCCDPLAIALTAAVSAPAMKLGLPPAMSCLTRPAASQKAQR